MQLGEHVVPIEVKAGVSNRIKSMHLFLASHRASPYGMRFSARPYEQAPTLHLYPLYAVAKPLLDANDAMRQAILALAA